MQPLFSLILPCYQVEKYVERCVRSILSQSVSDYEIILVDDGSRDGTPQICDALAAEHACIRVVHKENGGLASARNKGLSEARGRYVWFIDSDDWIEPDALAALAQACMDGQPDMVKFNYNRVTDQKQEIPGVVPDGEYDSELQREELLRKAFCAAGKYGLSAWSHVYRREFLRTNQLAFVSERVICSEDYLFNLAAMLQAQRITVLNKPLYCYELRAGSLTQSYKPDLASRYTELYRQLKEICRQRNEWIRYEPLADRFYVWHLMIGTGFQHEYRIHAAKENLDQARKNVHRMMKLPAFRQAVCTSDKVGLTWKKKLMLLAVLLRAEWLFCWLCTRGYR